jgi:hypothetical protein
MRLLTILIAAGLVLSACNPNATQQQPVAGDSTGRNGGGSGGNGASGGSGGGGSGGGMGGGGSGGSGY